MRQTGIVRRIDELGRVVIPKELRRTMRLREGEEVEVMQKDDTLILKKYSAISEMIDFQFEYASSVNKATGFSVVLTDNDRVIASSGDHVKAPTNTLLGEGLRRAILERRTKIIQGRELVEIAEGMQLKESKGMVLAPIMKAGDLMGAILLFSAKEPNELAVKTAETGADFIAKRL